jgi:hypothetical protein
MSPTCSAIIVIFHLFMTCVRNKLWTKSSVETLRFWSMCQAVTVWLVLLDYSNSVTESWRLFHFQMLYVPSSSSSWTYRCPHSRPGSPTAPHLLPDSRLRDGSEVVLRLPFVPFGIPNTDFCERLSRPFTYLILSQVLVYRSWKTASVV